MSRPLAAEELTMNVLAAVFAILMILAELLALFGAATGGWDMAILGLVFLGFAVLFMCLPVPVRRP